VDEAPKEEGKSLSVKRMESLMAQVLSVGAGRSVRWRLTLIGVLAAALVAGTLTNPAPAAAEGERPFRSSTPGLTAPEYVSDPIPVNLVIAPRPGESFKPFTVTSVQFVPMTKVLRSGEIDPNHAIAQWEFTIRFARSPISWPPQIPEPTDPWVFHLYEMPDGGITGIGPSHMGSPLYSPTDVPADWLQRMLTATRTEIPQATLEAAVMGNVMEYGISAAGLPTDLLPPWEGDVGAWGNLAISAFFAGLAGYGALSAMTIGGVVSGPCGLYVGSVILNELGAWAEMAMLSTSSPTARVVRAGSAVLKKLTSTTSLLMALDTCGAQAVAAGVTPLGALYLALAGIATGVWGISVLKYLVAGLEAAIAMWS